MPGMIKSEHDPEKLTFWRVKIEEQRAAGVSQAEFCRQNNLTERAFSFWKGVIFPELKPAERTEPRQRRRIKLLSPDQRNRLVKKWEKSGLTQANFCKKQNIFEWEFSNWKTKMIREAKKAAASKRPGFVEVRVDKEKPPETTKPLTNIASSGRIVAEFHFSGGSISIFSEAEVADVKKIVIALRECANDRTK